MPAPSRLHIEISDQGERLVDPAHIFDPVDVDAPNECGTNMNELWSPNRWRPMIVTKGRSNRLSSHSP
jgi:hypothetical protein